MLDNSSTKPLVTLQKETPSMENCTEPGSPRNQAQTELYWALLELTSPTTQFSTIKPVQTKLNPKTDWGISS